MLEVITLRHVNVQNFNLEIPRQVFLAAKLWKLPQNFVHTTSSLDINQVVSKLQTAVAYLVTLSSQICCPTCHITDVCLGNMTLMYKGRSSQWMTASSYLSVDKPSPFFGLHPQTYLYFNPQLFFSELLMWHIPANQLGWSKYTFNKLMEYLNMYYLGFFGFFLSRKQYFNKYVRCILKQLQWS